MTPGVTRRDDRVLTQIDHDGLGIEIGPSYNPIAPKSKGYKLEILDHLSSEDLRAQYSGHGVNLSNIEDIDFIWSGEPISELVGRHGRYDWIIASHVIEHLPDLISFLREPQKLLKATGGLALVIPEMNYCLEDFSPTTSTGQFLDAFFDNRQRPTPSQVFDHFANACMNDRRIAGGETSNDPAAFALVHDFDQARAHWHQVTRSKDYIDTHCWRFNLDSFRLLISDLQQLQLIDLDIVATHKVEGCEFFATVGLGVQSAAETNRLSALGEIRQ